MSKFTSVGRRYFLRAAGLTLFAVVLTISAHAGPLYNFTSFDGIGDNGGGTTVNGINNNGDIVGFSSNANQTVLTNFIRNAGGSFNALNIFNDPLAMANGINDSRTVVGTSIGQAFTLTSGIPTFLPAVNPGATASEVAFGISDTGLVVGQYVDNNTGSTPGFLLKNGAFTVLNPIANALVTNAQSVNDNGLVAGFYSTDGLHDHGFLYNSLTSSFILAPDPIIPNLVLTQFLGINDQGMVSGYYQLPDGSQHGFLYNTATKTYSFLDDPNAAKSGVSITQITGINDAGELAGFYVDANGLQRGFFATLAPTATPEPSSLVLLFMGIAVAWGARQRRLMI